MIHVFHTRAELHAWRAAQQGKSIGFVPTMGALHAGHAKLLQESVKDNELTVLSVFVNPTQFGPKEDLSKYPRTLASDIQIAETQGVDVVFAPNVDELYPKGYSTYVTEEAVSQPLCGQSRPGHFRGVTTIVLKLFNLVEPTRSYFGLKDAQQFLVIQQMVKDLNLRVKVIGIPTVREESGLALSSRNVFLTEHDRTQRAPKIYEALSAVKYEIQTGTEPAIALANAKARLTAEGFEVQYLEVRSVPELGENLASKELMVAVAAFLVGGDGGKIRLIDNVFFDNCPPIMLKSS